MNHNKVGRRKGTSMLSVPAVEQQLQQKVVKTMRQHCLVLIVLDTYDM